MHQTLVLRSFPWIRNIFGKINSSITEDCKLVILVRADLQMTKGKIAVSCAHAAVSCYVEANRKSPELAAHWLGIGQKKVVLRWDKGEDSLCEIAKSARKNKLIAVLIRDAGRTQVVPGSATALGIGPGSSKDIEKVVPGLKLL